jgi:probable addiction module antidote protein
MTQGSRRFPSRSHDAATVESLHRDPAFAAQYLNDVLADGDAPELLLALRRLADAQGGVSALARRARMNPTSLYRTLSRQGNPELRSVASLLKAMGLRLAVQLR